MDTKDLIDGFCGVPARRQLYEYASSQTEITLKPTAGDSWGSTTTDGQTMIYFARANHPEACLAHELLHAKLKCQGYKQYCVAR